MLKQILLVCAALLIPSAAFADDQTPEDDGSAEKDLCNDLGRDQYKCSLRSDICFWDSSDQRCEWVNDPGFCPQIFNPNSCNSVPMCFWDTSDQRCERL